MATIKNTYSAGKLEDEDYENSTSHDIELQDMGKYQKMEDGKIPVSLTEIYDDDDDQDTNKGANDTNDNTIDESNRTADEEPSTNQKGRRKPKVIKSVD